MSLQPFIPWLTAALVSAILGQVAGARIGSPWISGAAALFLPMIWTSVALKVNRPYWTQPIAPASTGTAAEAARRNARLLALAWGAGGASMLAVYLLSGLKWQHGWQYGCGMILIAMTAFAYGLAIGHPASRLRRPALLDAANVLVAAQGVAAIGGIMILVLTGKVASAKPDWAANVIFVAGGLTITILSAIAVRTHARLTPDDTGDQREL